MSEKTEFTERVVGPWTEYTDAGVHTDLPEWGHVDPMVRGVWGMAEQVQQERLLALRYQPWLGEFVLRKMQAEQRAADGDEWVTLHSSLREYFYADGFANLKFGMGHVERLLRAREDYTYVDWFATPAAIRSALYSTGTKLGLGVSVGLDAHGHTGTGHEENIHHISGSALDPRVQAQMFTLLGDRQIDLFTARPKGGMGLLPTSPEATSFMYYHRLVNSIYSRLSPDGLMFFETPKGGDNQHYWSITLEKWIRELQEQGIDADYSGTAMVLKKNDAVPKLPWLSEGECMNNPSLYYDSSKLRTTGWIANGVEMIDEAYMGYLEREGARSTL